MNGSGDDPRAKRGASDEEQASQPPRSSGFAPSSRSQTFAPPASDYVSGITTKSDRPALGQERRGSVTISLEAQSILAGKDVAAADTRGAARLLASTLQLRPRSALMILVSVEEEASLGAAFLAAVGGLGIDPVVYLVDPNEGANSVFIRRLSAQMADVSACVAVQGSAPFSPALIEAISAHPSAVIIDVPSDAVARQVLRADLEELHRLGVNLISRLEATTRLELSSGLAETLTLDLDRLREPIHYGGQPSPGKPLVLPAGQVIVRCTRADGSMTADGGAWLEDGRVIGRGASSRLEIENGMIQRVTGAAADDLEQALTARPGLRRVTAVGFGTNTSLVAGVGAKEVDLTLPGVFLLLGEMSDPRKMMAVVPRRPGVRGEGEAWMVRGRWGRELV
jgi:hypothetical protein